MKRGLLVTTLLGVACVTKVDPFVCSDSTQCSGGTCEATGYCSTSDPACTSGRRYVSEAGDLAGVCVGDESATDGPPGGADSNTVPGACGDGVTNTGEDCDDGNQDDGDGCVACAWARCGDGHLRAGAEQCDDGNTVDDDECTSGCVACAGGTDTLGANGHCYIRVSTGARWDEAVLGCADLGAHLAVYATMAESTAVGGWIPSGEPYWIGLTDSAQEDVWSWGAEPLDPAQANWAPGEPQNAQNKDCVRHVGGMGWVVDGCGLSFGYICEKEPFLLRPETNHAYLPMAALGTWQEAHSACTATPPAHLATVTDAGEQTFLQANARLTSWLGGQDLSTEGTFVWVNGDAFQYTNWAAGQPDDAPGGGADCIAMLPDGTWEDGVCDADAAWICEVD